MQALLTALYTKLSGSDLSNYVGGRIFTDEAPDGTDFPYVVIRIISSVPDKTFTEVYEDTLLQLSYFSTSAGLAEVSTMQGYGKALLDECSLSITGSTLVWMRRVNLVTMTDSITVGTGQAILRHWAEDYEIKTSLN
ncbi:MAG: DUF3168 domain-containing protein [Syntrophales bacterium]|jgi:hypothetical protein|nr:DUF3168 domain-containing protein [Syntrophales bacterium]